MNNKTIIIGLILIIIAAGAVYFYTRPEESTQNVNTENDGENVNNININTVSEDPDSAVGTNEPTTSNQNNTYSMAEVAVHDTADDCWMVINGMVYDVTDYIALHPGGNNILAGCGIDATDIFESKPDSGEPHSANAVQISQDYQIGEIQ